MSGYSDPIEAESPEDVIARLFAALAAAVPGWSAGGEGSLDVALTEEFGREAADLRYLALVREPARVFRAFGTSVLQVPALAGTAATMPVQVQLVQAGQSAPASLLLVGTTTDGVEVRFQTPPVPLVADPTSTTITTTATAVDAGDLGNGVPAGPLVLASSTATVLGVTATDASTGGTDAESDADYLDRLVQAQSTTVRSVVLARDAEIQARTVPGVHRALAVDNYDALTGDAAAERTVTVFAVDDSGNAVTGAVREALAAYLDSLRETNFVVRVAAPTYTPVHVQFTAVALPGRDPATVQAAVVARALQVLDPGTWGGGGESPPAWRQTRTVRFLDLAAQLDAVDGVDYVTSLTLNGAAGDATLTGVAPLPASPAAADPTTATGTVAPAGS